MKNEIQVIGVRHGEKLYETLLTKEECINAVDMGNFIVFLWTKES